MAVAPEPTTDRASRRAFLRSVLAATAAATLVPKTAAGASSDAKGAAGPYGPLAARDGSGLLLPEGFTGRVVARSGEPVSPGDLIWRGAPDGAATFDDGAGGWYHAVNHELTEPEGGVSVVHYDAAGQIVDAYSVLEGTSRNCAGGATPWGTWLSCEEVEMGFVYECDVARPGQGVQVPALGRFRHEAVAVDPRRQQVYLTEDQPDGFLYRFTPASYPDLADGVLEAAVVVDDEVAWTPVPDPQASDTATRFQLDGDAATRFGGGEGVWYHDDRVWFTTKVDGRVWELDVKTDRLRIVYDQSTSTAASVLTGVDNITVEAGSGDLFVAEDKGNMEVVVIAADGSVSPMLRIPGHDGSEVTGPVFNPAGDRLYVSSQRGVDGEGVTYEISGPFRGRQLDVEPGSGVTDTGLPWLGAGLAVATTAGVALLYGRRRARPELEGGPTEAETEHRVDGVDV